MNLRALLRILVATAIAGGAGSVARAQPSSTPVQELSKAREAVRSSKWGECKRRLTYVLYPKPKLSQATDINEAHLLLGVCHFETSDKDSADREIRTALVADSDLSLDPLLFSEASVKFFEAIKKDIKKKEADDAEKSRLARERDAALRAVRNARVIERSKLWVNFVPFGAGQFQNGQRKKAVAFAVSQAAFGAASMIAYGLQITRYGLGGGVPADKVDEINRLQVIQISTGAVALGLMAWGIIDALYHYKPQIERRADESEIEQMLREMERRERRKKKSSLLLLPAPSPRGDGGSLVLQWEF
jgi:hypothetical protein